MPRHGRLASNTGIYHICLRGINRQRLFEKAQDYAVFLDFIGETNRQSAFTLYAYCLMGNHVHLLLKEGAEPLAIIFKRLGTRYAQWFNREYDRCGHLFQDRFLSEPIENDEYFFNVLIYIYQNPVKAGLCSLPAEYAWSSRRFLEEENNLVDVKALRAMCPVSLIYNREKEIEEADMLDHAKIGRRPARTDQSAFSLLEQICGARSASEFQRLPTAGQQRTVIQLRSDGMPFRQISRIAGISTGTIWNWCKDNRD